MHGEWGAGHARGGPVPPGSAAGPGGGSGRLREEGRSAGPLPFPRPTRLTRLGPQAGRVQAPAHKQNALVRPVRGHGGRYPLQVSRLKALLPHILVISLIKSAHFSL